MRGRLPRRLRLADPAAEPRTRLATCLSGAGHHGLGALRCGVWNTRCSGPPTGPVSGEACSGRLDDRPTGAAAFAVASTSGPATDVESPGHGFSAGPRDGIRGGVLDACAVLCIVG